MAIIATYPGQHSLTGGEWVAFACPLGGSCALRDATRSPHSFVTTSLKDSLNTNHFLD